MENGLKKPTFEEVPAYLLNLSEKLDRLLLLLGSQAPPSEPEPYGDFNWLCGIFSNVPRSTLRSKSALGEIPGVVKFGKRVLYEKVQIFQFLHSQTRSQPNAAMREQVAETQFTDRHQRRGGRKAA